MSQALQLTLELEPGLLERHRNVREVAACGIYRRGLSRTAMEMDVAPGNLTCMLNDESQRKFGVDDLERYIQISGDLEPIRYLIARYMGDQAAAEASTMKRIEGLLVEVTALASQAGIKKPARR